MSGVRVTVVAAKARSVLSRSRARRWWAALVPGASHAPSGEYAATPTSWPSSGSPSTRATAAIVDRSIAVSASGRGASAAAALASTTTATVADCSRRNSTVRRSPVRAYWFQSTRESGSFERCSLTA